MCRADVCCVVHDQILHGLPIWAGVNYVFLPLHASLFLVVHVIDASPAMRPACQEIRDRHIQHTSGQRGSRLAVDAGVINPCDRRVVLLIRTALSCSASSSTTLCPVEFGVLPPPLMAGEPASSIGAVVSAPVDAQICN